jgi:hypothetical protein
MGLAQLGDLLGAESELLEHRAGVLAEAGRRRHQAARRARQRQRLAHQGHALLVLGLDRLGDPQMLDLGVGEHLVDGIDRPAGDTGLVEALDPVGAGALGGIHVDLGIEGVAVLGAVGGAGIFRPCDPFRRAQRLAEAFPDLLPRGGDVDVAVRGLEHAGRNAGGMIVAGLLGHLALDQPARRLKIEHEDLGLEQRGLDFLALAGGLALQQRDQDAHGAEQPGGQVGDRDTDPHRPLPGDSGDRHQPAHALGDLVEAGALRIGTGLAEAGNARKDDARIDLAQHLVVDPQPFLDVGPEVLDHHVGLLDHFLEGGDALGRLEVERDAALVAMQVHEIRAVPGAAQRLAGVQGGGRFDLDDVRAPIGELTHASGAGADPGQIEHGKTAEGLGGPWKRHFLLPNDDFLEAHPDCKNHPAGATFLDLGRIVYRRVDRNGMACRGAPKTARAPPEHLPNDRPMNPTGDDAPRVPAERLRTFIAAAFAAAGLPGEDAQVLGELIAEADLRGTDTHGVFRMPLYLRRIKAGGINPRPDIKVIKERAATALIDGDNGMGHDVGWKRPAGWVQRIVKSSYNQVLQLI